jgi:HAD superfamily hydrolase (TIGR01509 family)
MKTLSALIFDVDGTIAQTERDGHRVAFNRAFAAKGLGWMWTVEQYGRLLDVAGGKERIAYYADRFMPNFRPPTDMKTFAAELHALKGKFYRQLVEEGAIGLRPGIRRLMEEAREAGVKLAIATTSSLDSVLPLLQTTLEVESVEWFDLIAAGDIVPVKKPAPDIYLHVIRQMEIDPDCCLVLEDSQQGLRSAVAAGLKTIVTYNDYTRGQDFRSAALVLDGLGDVDSPFRVTGGLLRDNLTEATFFDLALANHLINL